MYPTKKCEAEDATIIPTYNMDLILNPPKYTKNWSSKLLVFITEYC